ncbi:MAG: hypothetical protein IPM82_26655 [Saprospiraceae bacterium]|nr:hypothetical protein [Saprospiraceae bacterium]
MLVPGFYLLLSALLAVLFIGLNNARVSTKSLGWFGIGAAAWLCYIAGLASTGFFQVFTMPPRFPIFLVLPAFVFIGWFFWSGRAEHLLRAVPKHQPIYLQSFRIVVELLILGMFKKGMATYEPTLEGYNFDMVMGLTAPFVAWLVFNKKWLPEKLALIWNYIGLLALANVVFIFISLFVKPQLWGYAETPVSPEFGTMPYLLIPAVYMPLAVFLHVFSIRQLSRKG